MYQIVTHKEITSADILNVAWNCTLKGVEFRLATTEFEGETAQVIYMPDMESAYVAAPSLGSEAVACTCSSLEGAVLQYLDGDLN